MSEDTRSALNNRQQLFVDDYLIHFSATKAAKNAGYSEKTAYSQGQRLLKNVEIISHVESRLKESRMGSDKVMKMMSDIAGSNINDYFKVVDYESTDSKKISIPEWIELRMIEIKKKERYLELSPGIDEDSKTEIIGHISWIYDEIKKAKIDLEFDANAFKEIAVPIIRQRVELDLIKLAADKESGKIKSFEMKEFGPKVELYPVDAMLDKLARVNGMYTDTLIVDDNNKIDPEALSDQTLRELLQARKRSE